MSLRRLGAAGGLIVLALVSTGCFLIQAGPNPGNNQNYLLGVSCPVPGSCTAVGDYVNSDGTGGSLIETGGVDGVTWSVVPSPNNGTPVGVSCLSTKFCMAVGSGGVSTSTTFAESWDGTTWSVVPSPSPGTQRNVLRAVSCVSTAMCTAVGGDWNGTPSPPPFTLVESWNGTTWSVVPSPNPSAHSNDLSGVSCVSASFCVAVGATQGASTNLSFTLVEMWDGTTWSVVPSPDPSTASSPFNTLSSVSCVSTTSCTAVGSYLTNTTSNTLIESWDGTTWSVVPSPNASGSDGLLSVSCVSTTSCTAVGDFNNAVPRLQTLVETLNGSTWSVVPSPNSSSSDINYLNGVSCPPGGTCTAVGSSDTGNGAPVHILITHDVPIS